MNVVFSALNPPYRNPDFPAATLLLLLAARSVTLGQALNLSVSSSVKFGLPNIFNK